MDQGFLTQRSEKVKDGKTVSQQPFTLATIWGTGESILLVQTVSWFLFPFWAKLT